MSTKQVSVRIAAVGGKQVKAELVDIGAAGERMGQRLDRGAKMGGGGLQNVGFQVQDFAVQIGAGTSATQALAQQLPQLLSGFGVFGVVAGTATAIAIPLAAALFGTADNAKSLTDAMDGLTRATADYKEAVEGATFDRLAEQFGEVTPAVLEFQRQLQELRLTELRIAAAEAANALGSMFDGGFFSSSNAAVASLLSVANGVRTVNPEVERFQLLLEQASQSGDFPSQLAAIDAIQAALIGAAGSLEGMTEAQRKVYSETIATEGALRAAWAAAGGLEGSIGGAADQAARLAANSREAAAAALEAMNMEFSPGGQALENYGSRAPGGTAEQNALAGRNAPPPARSRGGGGGGGRSSAASLVQQTPEITAAMKAIEEQTKRVDAAAQQINNSFADAFTAIVTGSSSAEEALSQLFANLASQLASSAFDGLFGAGGVFGEAGIAGLLGFGGGKAGGGPVRAGMSYMVGENGPEMVTMGGNGYVTTNAELRRSAIGGAGGVSISIDARGAQEGVAQQIRRELQKAAPQIIQQSVAASRAASARGA